MLLELRDATSQAFVARLALKAAQFVMCLQMFDTPPAPTPQPPPPTCIYWGIKPSFFREQFSEDKQRRHCLLKHTQLIIIIIWRLNRGTESESQPDALLISGSANEKTNATCLHSN